MSSPDIVTKEHFHKIATQFDDLYETENRGALQRKVDDWLRASIYRRFELAFESMGSLEGKRVLDVGCGGGRYSVMAAQLGAEHVLGVDFAPNMIELCKDLQVKNEIPESQLEFVCGDATEVPMEKPANFAIAMGVFDYVEDPAPFLKAVLSRVTERAVCSFPAKWNVWTPQRIIRYRLFKNCPLYVYSQARIQQVCRDAGASSFKILNAARDFVAVVEK